MEKSSLHCLSLPLKFQEHFIQTWGEEEYLRLSQSLKEAPPVSLRINPFKAKGANPDLEPVKWCSQGYYLPGVQGFTFDPKFHSGTYYVQEASSMFLEQWVKKYVSSPSL